MIGLVFIVALLNYIIIIVVVVAQIKLKIFIMLMAIKSFIEFAMLVKKDFISVLIIIVIVEFIIMLWV